MKSLYNMLFLPFIFVFCFSLQAMEVKVLLATFQQGDTFTLSASEGFVLKDPVSHNALKLEDTCKKFNLECRADGMYVDSKRLFKEKIIFEPYGAACTYDGQKYWGYFLIRKIEEKYLLINVVPLEEYVFSVLKTESWPGWPLEMNKVMAIITRTYCLHHIMLSYQKKLPYHIRNSNHHQTYQGVHNCAIAKKAVDDTKGLFVSYKGLPILAMFDCCCGGVVPGNIEGSINFKKAPYLGRDYACTYCKYSKVFNWSTTYSLDQFMDLVQEEVPFIIHDIKDVKVTEVDKAGLVRKVAIRTSDRTIELNSDQMYRLSSKIKSSLFTINKKGKKVVIKGKGFGHHIGLCQWGAREMVRLEYAYKQILEFYYPETDLMRFVEGKGSGKAKGGLCQDIKGILSEVQLRSLA